MNAYPAILAAASAGKVVKLYQSGRCRSRTNDEILPCSSCRLELRADAGAELVNSAVRLKAAWDFVAVDVGHGHVERSHSNACESIQHVQCFAVVYHCPAPCFS